MKHTKNFSVNLNLIILLRSFLNLIRSYLFTYTCSCILSTKFVIFSYLSFEVRASFLSSFKNEKLNWYPRNDDAKTFRSVKTPNVLSVSIKTCQRSFSSVNQATRQTGSWLYLYGVRPESTLTASTKTNFARREADKRRRNGSEPWPFLPSYVRDPWSSPSSYSYVAYAFNCAPSVTKRDTERSETTFRNSHLRAPFYVKITRRAPCCGNGNFVPNT